LVELHAACTALSQRLSQAGVAWDVLHIYREYNGVADGLANEGVDLGAASDGW